MQNLFNSFIPTTGITVQSLITILAFAIIIGVFNAYLYTVKIKYTKSFVTTIATLPAIVAMVIIMVNGNIGTGVAVAGAFSLVRFRSIPGTAKEIGAIFLAMSTGLILGMGYIGYAAIFAIIIAIVNTLLTFSHFPNDTEQNLRLRITIPEDLDYTDIFDDIFEEYVSNYDLESVKSINMGSLFRLTYTLDLKEDKSEKAFLDDLRIRNGNLEVMISKASLHIQDSL
jgi:hypothetical protein